MSFTVVTIYNKLFEIPALFIALNIVSEEEQNFQESNKNYIFLQEGKRDSSPSFESLFLKIVCFM
jgi:hypothetical protein